MILKELKYDNILDVLYALNDDALRELFVLNIVEINEKIFKLSEGKVHAAIIEEKKNAKFCNVDVEVFTKALLLAFKQLLNDDYLVEKIKTFFEAVNKDRTKNLKLVISYLAYHKLCLTQKSNYLTTLLLIENKKTNSYIELNSIGFSSNQISKTINDEKLTMEFENLCNKSYQKISVASYGIGVNNFVSGKGIPKENINPVSKYIEEIKI